MNGWTLSEHGKGEASTALPFEDEDIELAWAHVWHHGHCESAKGSQDAIDDLVKHYGDKYGVKHGPCKEKVHCSPHKWHGLTVCTTAKHAGDYSERLTMSDASMCV